MFPLDADYDVELQLGSGTAAGQRNLELNIDGQRVKLFSISPPVRGRGQAPPQQAQDPDAEASSSSALRARIPIQAGSREIAVTFVQAAGSVEIEGSRDIFRRPGPFHEGNQLMPVHEPFLGSVTITGPFNARPWRHAEPSADPRVPPKDRTQESACARTILTTWRAGHSGARSRDRHTTARLLQRESDWRIRERHRADASATPGQP